MVVTAVDMPRVTRDQLAWLASALKARPEASGLMIRRTGPSGTSHVEPFPCAFHTRFAPTILPRLVQANRALHRLADDPSVLTVAPPADWPDETWTNLNTPADLAALDAPHRPPPR